ncbi:MAG: hypothetical protein EA249_07810 [Alkalibacterium sp.]|nr:MAG: hypothetical protein EA249_07810 [Alkalibacterium sp.]
MKLKDIFIYVVGTISVIITGLVILGSVAFFMMNRIESATSNHAQREVERIAEVGGEPEPTKREIYKDAEFVIENAAFDDDRNHGVIEWRTTEGLNGEYQSGEVIFYITFHGDISIRERTTEYPKFVSYLDELNEAIEGAVPND